MLACGYGQVEEAVSCGVPVWVSHRVVSEVSISDTERGGREVCGEEHTDAVRVAGGRDTGAEREGGTRASGGERAAEGVDIEVDGGVEREDSDKAVWEVQSAKA